MRKTGVYMDTIVDIQVVTKREAEEAEAKINAAFHVFQIVEQACSRFAPSSELMRACQIVDRPVEISPWLFQPLSFALEVAKLTDGLFDPAIGKIMEINGFNHHYVTGNMIESPAAFESVSYRDIILNPQKQTITLNKPLVIDLGAVAKGFAIDMAANELKDFEGFIVNAGGDLFAGGLDGNGMPWKIGIQHPELLDGFIDKVEISNEAICTSGSYERRNPTFLDVHHLVNPKTGRSPNGWVSCSIIAPFAMMADAFSTAAFFLSPENAKSLMENLSIKGLLVTPELQTVRVGEFE